MAEVNSTLDEIEVSRERLADLLNEDLAREYQAIIAYVVYSQVLTGAQYMDIAAQLEIHARQELDHALILSRQIDYLGKMPVVTPKPVRTSKDAKEMLRFDLDNENETIRNYRDRVPPMRGAWRIRAGRADPPDSHPGARSSNRPGDRARHRSAEREQRPAETLPAEASVTRERCRGSDRGPRIAASRSTTWGSSQT